MYPSPAFAQFAQFGQDENHNDFVGDSTMLDQSTGQTTPSAAPFSQGLLPRDQQARSAYYDYATEKSLSHAEAKLFFQQQLDQEQQTPTPFRATMASSSNIDGDIGTISRTASMTSKRSYVDDNNGNHFHSVVPLGLASIDKPVSVADVQMPDLTRFDLHKHLSNHDLQEPLTTASDYPRGQLEYHGIDHNHDSTLTTKEQFNPTGLGSAKQATAGGLASKDLNVTAELSAIYSNIQNILDIRHKYIRLSLQGSGDNPKDDPSWNIYPPPPEPAWNDDNRPVGTQSVTTSLSNSMILSFDKDSVGASSRQFVRPSNDMFPQAPLSPSRKARKPGQDIGEDFDLSDLVPLPEEVEMSFKLDDSGVYQVYENSESAKLETPIVSIPTIRDFYIDLDSILTINSDGPTKSFAFTRLQYLEAKFNLYFLLNKYQEVVDTKQVPHRDFYNVRKVDTHVHHTSCMNQKHLLRFIKSKMKKSPDEVVLFRDGQYLTLREVFDSIQLTAYHLSIDTLDMHVSHVKASKTHEY